MKIGLSFLIAIMLTILPLPVWFIWFCPKWVVLVLIYWLLTKPKYVGITIAWLVGLLLDILTGTVLGGHALSLVIIAYLMIRLKVKWQFFGLLQQTFIVFIMVLIYQALLFWLQSITVGHVSGRILYWMPTISSALFWAVVNILLYSSYPRKRVSGFPPSRE